MNRRLLSQQDLPEFEPVPLTLAMLVAEGMRLVQEQQMVNNTKLGEEYMVRLACVCVCVWGGGGLLTGTDSQLGGGGLCEALPVGMRLVTSSRSSRWSTT